MSKKIIILLSGGLDSAVLLKYVKAKGYDPIGLALDYGQLHKKELRYSLWQAENMGIEWQRLDIKQAFEDIKNPILCKEAEVPTGTYADQAKKGNLLTYVPNRNMILLSIAAAQALSRGIKVVGYGAHKDDLIKDGGSAYPDCSPEFVNAMNAVLQTQGICLYAPFVMQGDCAGFNKGMIVKKGIELNVDFSRTWSCYKDGDRPCGECATCKDRAKAFEEAGIADPLLQL